MTAPIGVGYYQRSINVRNGLLLYLFHLRPQAAAQCRRDNPGAFIVGRFDSGDDGTQARFDLLPEIAATDFFRTQIEPVVRANPGVYSAILGINEAWPNKDGLKWRADFELALCRLVQGVLKLPYIWGGISTGCLDAADVPTFAPVWREAWATNYHAYLAEGHKSIEEEIAEDWNVNRPVAIWLSELKKLGIKLRLFVGELGTYFPILKDDAMAACQIGIHRWVRDTAAYFGIDYVGACAYGAGMMGFEQGKWELEGSVERFAEANSQDGATAPTGTVPAAPPDATHPTGGQEVMLTIGQGLRKAEPIVGPYRESEIYHFPTTEGEVSLAVGALGVALWMKSRNETYALSKDGQVWGDAGNSGDGRLKRLR